jgi:hypothetical protein
MAAPREITRFSRNDVTLVVKQYAVPEAKTLVNDRTAFRFCSEWLSAAHVDNTVFLCEIAPGGRLDAKGPVRPTTVVVGFVVFEYTPELKVHVKHLCSFITGLCIGSLLLCAVVKFGIANECHTLALEATSSARPFYTYFSPSFESRKPAGGLYPMSWHNLPLLYNALNAQLQTCKMHPLQLVYDIYILWLQFRAATASSCRLYFENDDDESFDAKVFLEYIERCKPFRAELERHLPTYASELMALADAAVVPQSNKRRKTSSRSADETFSTRTGKPFAPARPAPAPDAAAPSQSTIDDTVDALLELDPREEKRLDKVLSGETFSDDADWSELTDLAPAGASEPYGARARKRGVRRP